MFYIFLCFREFAFEKTCHKQETVLERKGKILTNMFLAVFVLMFLLRFDVIIAESFYFNGEQYIVTNDNTISVSKYSYDVVFETLATCALMCTLQAKCCGCSFSVKNFNVSFR